MIVEVVAIGTELLLGQIVNTNAATIGAALADHGFDAHYQTVVGDNLERIAQAVRLALGRADAVILTGGIGPTQDDLTREGLAAAVGRPLLRSEEYAQQLRDRFRAWGREMPASNLRQADYPEGAELLPNPKGTAPGLALEERGKLVFVVPGVPEEMELLLTSEVLPRLHHGAGGEAVVLSRVLRSWGRSESQMADLLDDLYRGHANPSLAYLASSGEIKIRITAKAPTREAAAAMIVPVEDEVRRRLHPSVFGADGETIEEVIRRLFGEKAWTLAVAESATGGMVAGRITSVPGASAYFRGGVVSYASDVKRRLLGVEEGRVVSEEAARSMAAGTRRLLGADVAVAVTGSAGPEPQDEPVGTMIIAVETPERAAARTLRFPGDRERVRTYATTAALHLLRLAVTGEWWRD